MSCALQQNLYINLAQGTNFVPLVITPKRPLLAIEWQRYAQAGGHTNTAPHPPTSYAGSAPACDPMACGNPHPTVGVQQNFMFQDPFDL